MGEKIRAPILTTLGHIDHGKTTLLDCIRGTAVAKKEPGQITQLIGCSFIPLSVIENVCGELLKKFKIKIEIPGLLIIDTPGHEAFTSLRRRGGSIADLAILVVDINTGIQEQTDESLELLKRFKVPFVVAATKVDKISGWKIHKTFSFLETFADQRDDVKDEVEKKVYELVLQLVERNFDSERFDRIEDFKKKIAIVPCSGITGEGIAELLLVLCGLSQHFLKEKLFLGERGKGNILEIKEVRGLGTTADAILYSGRLKRGDYIIIGGKEPIVTKVKAILIPRPLQELRVEKKFMNIKTVNAAIGVKIVAPNLENAIAGSPFVVCESEKELEKALEEIKKEVELISFEKNVDGVILKADTIGSLEALIFLAKKHKIPVRKVEIGAINKEDVTEADLVKNDERRVIFGFNVKTLDDAKENARKFKIKIFEGNIIYKIFEEYEEWLKELRERKILELLSKTGRPVRVRVLKGCIFRSSKPCIVGVEVLDGKLIPGVNLQLNGKFVGKVKEIQKSGETIYEANPGEKVAISMEEPVAKKDFFENDILESLLGKKEIKILEGLKEKLSDSEIRLLEEIKKKLKL
jgi:translation initiation factor 5B